MKNVRSLTRLDKLKIEFYNKFAIRNNSSKTGIWWQLPPVGFDSREIASPMEVWEWIKDLLK